MDERMISKPTAWIPVALSLAALGLVFTHLAVVGNIREPDEGADARIFQLLLVVQLPVIALFAVRWVPRAPRPALLVLALQGGLAMLAIATVALLEAA